MAEESDLSRTEPASPRRLQEAREAGDVPRSRELGGWLMLLAALGVLSWQAPVLFEALRAAAVAAFTHAAQPFAPVFVEAATAVAWALLPVLAALFVAALVGPMLLSGWVFAPQRAEADLSRAQPFKPFSRLLSADAWFDGGLALFKLALVAIALGWALSGDGWTALATDMDPASAAAWIGRGLLALTLALALAAALDAGWRWWRYLQRHAMTWQEVLAEAREAELPPEVQAQLRARQQQAGQGVAAGSLGEVPPSPFIPGRGQPSPSGGEEAKVALRAPRAINEVIG